MGVRELGVYAYTHIFAFASGFRGSEMLMAADCGQNIGAGIRIY